MGYIKVTALGGMAGNEIWNTSACFNIVGIGPHTIDFAMAQSIAARIVTAVTAASIPAALKSLLSTDATIIGWRVDGYDDNDVSTAQGLANYAAPVPGFSLASKTPQDAIVFSLRTNHAGRNGRGRMYWPALGATLGVGWKMTGPTPTATALGAATLLDLIGDQINAELAANSLTETVELCVRSRTDKESYRVGSIQVGDIIDTQRRRRNKLLETYVSQSYPLP